MCIWAEIYLRLSRLFLETKQMDKMLIFFAIWVLEIYMQTVTFIGCPDFFEKLNLGSNIEFPCEYWIHNVSTDVLRTQIGRTMNGEISLVADQIYEIWNCTIFVIWVFRRKSKLCTGIYTKLSSLIINLHEQQTYTFIQFSDLAKNWHFAHLSLSIFLYPYPSIQKVLIYKESSEML